MALSSRKNVEQLIKDGLVKLYSAQYQDKLPARHQLKLDQPALRLLKRLANSNHAVRTLAQLENWCERKGRASCWREIVLACVIAEQQARTFPENIKKAKEALVRGARYREQLRRALAELRKFLCENSNQNWAVLWDNAATIARGLDLLDYGIETEKCVAEEAFAQFGATRKTTLETAPRNAAIWALAEAMKLYTGKPHRGEVASLASVIFGTTIDENIVKHAVGERRLQFEEMQKRRAERLLELTGSGFGRIPKGRN
jgi:hypothetical protein